MTNLVVLFLLASAQYNLPPNLLSSICYVETKHNPQAIHLKDGIGNSVGICQLKRTSAQLVGFKGTEKDLLQPEVNIKYAAAYLAHQRSRYHGDIKKAVISYNMGSAKGLTKTNYSDKVFKQWEVSSR